MTDFKYDSQDISAIKVASADLNSTQASAFVGAFAAISAKLAWDARTSTNGVSFWRRIPLKNLPNMVLVGGLGYGIVIYLSGRRYDAAAGQINRKYSSILSQTMNYN